MQGRPLSVRWITGPRFDLLCYIGAAATGYLFIYLNVWLGISALFLYWLWIVSVDGPHVFATVSRTYLDREEWKTRSRLLLGSLLWFLPGPLIFFASLAAGMRLPFLIFLVFAQLWAYWHVIRQHYGFLVLYQKKNGEPAGKNNAWDYWIFYILMIAPFVSFLIRHPEARYILLLSPQITEPEKILLVILNCMIAGAILLYIRKEVSSSTPLNVPKNLFLLACVPLHLLIFLHPYISTHVPLVLFAVFVTFYHNIQYHGIVWFHNRNRYGRDFQTREFGPASFISRNFLIYYLAGLLFTITYRYSNWFFTGLQVPFASGPNSISGASIGGLFHVSDLALGFWWGFAFNHYYLDQRIWRVSKDRKLTGNLRVEPAVASAV